MISYCRTLCIRCSESLGSSGQVLVAQYLGLARDSRKALGLDAKAPWVGDAQEFRETARSIAKRVLTLSLGLGLGLAASSMAIFPVLLAVVCRSAEVAALVSQVCTIAVCSCVCRRNVKKGGGGWMGRGGGGRRREREVRRVDREGYP